MGVWAPAGDSNVNGFGLEFFIETPAEEIGSSLSEIKRSWQFQLLYTVSQLAAGHGGIRNIIDDMQLLSTEAEGVNGAIPEEFRKAHVNRDGRVGALLGLTDTRLGAPDCESAPAALHPSQSSCPASALSCGMSEKVSLKDSVES